MKSDKRYMIEGVEQPNQVIIRTLGEKETYKILGDIRSWHDRTSVNVRNNFTKVSQKNHKTTRDKTL